MLDPVEGPRRLPTLLLYDNKGLQLFEEITYLDEYYLTNYEIALLKASVDEIASSIPAHSLLVELGSGNLRKVCLLLEAFERLAKPVDYYALDLSQQELERTLAHLPRFEFVACHGLLGTIGNFDRPDAASFLQSFADLLDPVRDRMLIGLDSCSVPEKV
ncbi:hypothetical protein CDD80_1656 [Ophiocordyceps camponoti-rufipedis]|uniref:Histidine-specific methyltransferase SAM-dependent domain-containing protein n=1 Tax=Ophiocordyceps camponoti-rufipedis TaxID=2004952 RepID=A0A2C5XSK8_9HYPO|nr:hypothetical protein CDD80_1656 [Ophiocordyceps camponoti-rufipedis]